LGALGWSIQAGADGARHRAAAGSAAVTVAPAAAPASTRGSVVQHYEYVFVSGSMYVYDMDAGQRLVQRVELPMTSGRGVRGAVASPSTHTLYVSYGGDGGGNGNGSLLAYDLLSGRVLWTRDYQTGIDSMAITPDGSRIYMPTGEIDKSGIWQVLNAGNGEVIGTIQGPSGAHNTVMSLDGRYVFLGGRDNDHLYEVSTASNQVVQTIGPLQESVRPFTINGRDTLAFTTATHFLGFQVSSITTGRVLYTESFPGFSWDPASFKPSAPSHGISLSPDERLLWVMDAPNSYVHVFDVSGLPGQAPRLIANVALSEPMSGMASPCAYDCERDGWIQDSRDGRFVYVGDSGDVIDAHSYKIVAYLPALRESRVTLEIDWRSGLPIAATPREGVGYVTAAPAPQAPPATHRRHRRHRHHRRPPHRAHRHKRR
jgi:DNA-binding beta-propeller fold protein YncE